MGCHFIDIIEGLAFRWLHVKEFSQVTVSTLTTAVSIRISFDKYSIIFTFINVCMFLLHRATMKGSRTLLLLLGCLALTQVRNEKVQVFTLVARMSIMMHCLPPNRWAINETFSSTYLLSFICPSVGLFYVPLCLSSFSLYNFLYIHFCHYKPTFVCVSPHASVFRSFPFSCSTSFARLFCSAFSPRGPGCEEAGGGTFSELSCQRGRGEGCCDVTRCARQLSPRSL